MADVAIIGVPDERRGELVKAVVVAKKGERFRQSVFDEFASVNLASYKRPRVVELVTGDLPRNALGKVLRRTLRSPPAAPSAIAEPQAGLVDSGAAPPTATVSGVHDATLAQAEPVVARYRPFAERKATLSPFAPRKVLLGANSR